MQQSRIKVLFAINCLNIGGAPSVVLDQVNNLDKKIFDPHVLTLYPSKSANYLEQIGRVVSSPQQHHFVLKRRSIFDFKTIVSMYSLLRRERFDIVYTHLFLTNLLVRLCAIVARVPIIVSFEHSMYTNKKKWNILADKFLSFWTQKIIVSTQAVAEFTIKQQFLKKEKVYVIPNEISVPDKSSVDMEALHEEFHIPENKKIIVSIGRFSEEKGQDILIEAVVRMIHERKDLFFLIIGHGNLENILREKIVSLGIGEYVMLINEPQRAKDFLYIADLFVLSSLREGQGMVVYESMMAGVPVLASDLPPIRAIIADKKNGFLFEAGNNTALSEALFSIIDNEEVLLKVAEKGKETMAIYKEQNRQNHIQQLFKDLYETHDV